MCIFMEHLFFSRRQTFASVGVGAAGRVPSSPVRPADVLRRELEQVVRVSAMWVHASMTSPCA